MRKYVSLSEETAEKLKHMILDEGIYSPGQKLPNESDLSKELSVSRTSIREAVKILISGNILEIRRGVGTFVKENPGAASNLFDMLYLSDKKETGVFNNMFKNLVEALKIEYKPEIDKSAELQEALSEENYPNIDFTMIFDLLEQIEGIV